MLAHLHVDVLLLHFALVDNDSERIGLVAYIGEDESEPPEGNFTS